MLANRLAESLDPLEDGYIRQLCVAEARTHRDEVGVVKTISAQEGLELRFIATVEHIVQQIVDAPERC